MASVGVLMAEALDKELPLEMNLSHQVTAQVLTGAAADSRPQLQSAVEKLCRHRRALPARLSVYRLYPPRHLKLTATATVRAAGSEVGSPLAAMRYR